MNKVTEKDIAFWEERLSFQVRSEESAAHAFVEHLLNLTIAVKELQDKQTNGNKK